MMCRIGVIGDIHANAPALASALSTLDAQGFDRLVLLGDVLTYGVDVVQTLSLVAERALDPRTVLLLGNHDGIYRDLLRGPSVYYDGLPDWIKESIQWTLDRLPADVWRSLPFADDVTIGRLFLAHANTFGPEDWRYLRTADECAPAVDALSAKGLTVGVVGHTHRALWYRHGGGVGSFQSLAAGRGQFDASGLHIFNPGAIGQPRDLADPACRVASIDVDLDGVVEPRFVLSLINHDPAGYVRAVTGSTLSVETQARILKYFRAPA